MISNNNGEEYEALNLIGVLKSQWLERKPLSLITYLKNGRKRESH